MKTFNEFINEGHQFLRSIGKNDVVHNRIPANEVKAGDWVWYCNTGKAIHCQIEDVTLRSDGFLWKYQSPEGEISYVYWESDRAIDEYTSQRYHPKISWICTTDEEAFFDFKEKYSPTLKIVECPAK